MKNIYCVICGKYRTFKNLQISYSFKKNHQFFLLFAVRRQNDDEKISKEEKSIESLKNFGLIKYI